MVDLAAVLDISALRADLNDGERTLAGNLVERLERIPLAGERECLLLVGEQHVDVAVGQLVQKTEVLVYDVEAGQIEGHCQAAGLGEPDGPPDQFVVLDQIAFDIEAVVAVEQRFVQFVAPHLERGAEKSAHRPLAVGRDERDAAARPLVSAQDMGFDAEVDEGLLEEVSRRVPSHFADIAGTDAHAGHGPDRIRCRSAERQRARHAGYVFSDSALPVAVDQIHAASGQHEPLEDFVGFHVDQNIRQGIAHSDNAFHFFR